MDDSRFSLLVSSAASCSMHEPEPLIIGTHGEPHIEYYAWEDSLLMVKSSSCSHREVLRTRRLAGINTVSVVRGILTICLKGNTVTERTARPG
jgi:hypothetical protein